MCNDACVDFGRTNLLHVDIHEKKVIEVGALNVNGSLRRFVEELKPSSYLGVDIAEGPGVDDVCDALALCARYGKDSFDVVISTEALEHIRDWRGAISSMKNILRPNGILLLTTRSRGFGYHGYPFDFWRFELSDMEAIFGDLSMESIQADPIAPGVFVKARKPDNFAEKDFAGYQLYSIVRRKRCRDVRDLDIFLLKFKRTLRQVLSTMLPPVVKTFVKSISPNVSNIWRQ